MPGFWSTKETQSITRPDGKTLSCVSCGLYKGDLDHPKLQPVGKFKKKILNIGEFTTGRDDKKGKPFQDKDSYKLHKYYRELGIDLFRDCLNVNAVQCHPYNHKTGKARIPTSFEIQCCRVRLLRIIKEHKPKLIILFGKIAVDSVIGFRWVDGVGKMERWRGWVIPDQHYKAWVAPVFDPSYLSSAKEEKAVELIWRQDLKRAIEHLDLPFRKWKEPKITYLTKSLKPLNKISNLSTCAFDYETTGLKPHGKGHRIVCASIADSPDHAFVFMLIDKKQKQLKGKAIKPLIKFLLNKYIKKVAQHLKYEENWSFEIFGIRVNNWFRDTMYMSHILDNRKSITGLKFQAYVIFGIDDYSKDISDYLQSKDAVSLNRLLELVKSKKGKDMCLKYCAYDSIITSRLIEHQLEIEKNILPF